MHTTVAYTFKELPESQNDRLNVLKRIIIYRLRLQSSLKLSLRIFLLTFTVYKSR